MDTEGQEVDDVDSDQAVNSYTCGICKTEFSTGHFLIEHMNTHVNEKIPTAELNKQKRVVTNVGGKLYNCAECPKTFTKLSDLEIHSHTHARMIQYSCQICNHQFHDVSAFKEHMSTHTTAKKKPAYKCAVCNTLFQTLWRLKRHEKSHTGEKSYICKICDKTFAELHNLTRHSHVHTSSQETPYSCQICFKLFKDKSNLKRHLVLHSGVMQYKCDICYKEFPLKHYLTNHRQHAHADKNSLTNPKSDDSFQNLTEVQTHMAQHRQQGKPSLTTSDEDTSVKLEEKEHEQVHASHEMHCCRTCGEKFPNLSLLNIHVRDHKVSLTT